MLSFSTLIQNIFVISIIGTLFIGCDQQPAYSEVGSIPFNETLDDPNFKVCNENRIKQYYVRKSKDTPADYKGELYALKEEVYGKFKYPIDSSQNGYVTIRFMVNCEGKSGRFRIQVSNFELKEHQLNHELVSQLLEITKSLKGWMPVSRGKTKYDFYKFITYKIEKGQLTQILP